MKYSNTAVSCVKTAEPVTMPFGLWTRVGLRKHVLDGALLLRKDMPGHARRHFAISCAKMAEPIKLPFGL